jgi:hypothetical protein
MSSHFHINSEVASQKWVIEVRLPLWQEPTLPFVSPTLIRTAKPNFQILREGLRTIAKYTS